MRNFAVLQLSSSFYDLNNPFTTMWKQTDVQLQESIMVPENSFTGV